MSFDVLPAASGEDSYGVGCGSDLFGGFLPQPPLLQLRTTKRLQFWPCPAIGLLDGDDFRTNGRENTGLAWVTFSDGLTRGPYILGLNAEALQPNMVS